MKSIFALFLTLGQFCIAQNSLDKLLSKFNEGDIPYINVADLNKIKDSVIVLDAREKKEYSISHIPNAQYVGHDYFSLQKVDSLNISKNSIIVVYCSLGIRSEDIAKKIKNQGYSNVYNLYGGIFEWKNNAFKVINIQNKATDSIHIFSKKWGKWLHNGIKVY